MIILGTGYSTDLLLIFSFLLLLLLIFYLTSYKFLRKILFLFDPELIHKISFHFLKIIFLLPNYLSFWQYFFRIDNDKLKRIIQNHRKVFDKGNSTNVKAWNSAKNTHKINPHFQPYIDTILQERRRR